MAEEDVPTDDTEARIAEPYREFVTDSAQEEEAARVEVDHSAKSEAETKGVEQADARINPVKKKGAAALLKGLKNGEVAKIVDSMGEPPNPEAERAAKEEAERLEAEKAATAEAERLEAERAAKEEAERLEAEKAATAEAERLEAERAAKEEAERIEAEKAATAEAERLEAERAAKEEAERLEAEKVAKAEASISASGSEDLLAAAQQRIRELLPQVKDQEVLKELAKLADSDALEKLVQRGKPAPKAAGFSPAARSSLKSNPFMTENATKTQASKEAALDKSKHLGTVTSSSLATGGAGAGGGLGLNRPGFGPKVQHFAGGGGRGSMSKAIEIKEDVGAAWQEMLDDTSKVGWVIGTYTDDMKGIVLKNKGEGGLNAFKAELPSAVAWGGFRCYGVDKRGGMECKRLKIVFVQYKPEAVSQLKKARAAAHKGDVKGVFPGAHLDVDVETMEDLDEQALIEKLQAATGAHKPNGYDFGNGFLEADYYGLGIGKSCKGETTVN